MGKQKPAAPPPSGGGASLSFLGLRLHLPWVTLLPVPPGNPALECYPFSSRTQAHNLVVSPLLRNPHPTNDSHVIDCVAIGFGMNSRLPVRNRLTCPTWRKACFPGSIRLGWSEGLCSLVAMYASRFRNWYVRNGIASGAHVRNGGAKSHGRPYGGKFMRRRRSWKSGSEHRKFNAMPPRVRTDRSD